MNRISIPSGKIHKQFGPIPACLFIAVIGFAVYANAIHGEFVYDDIDAIRDNPALENPLDLASLNRSLSADRGLKEYFFRPLVILTFAVDRFFWKSDVRGYHVTSILWHVLAALALYGLSAQLYRDRAVSFLTALFFVIHPVHTEAVAYISGRADPLFLFFLFLCFIHYVRIHEDLGPPAVQTVLIGIFYGAALLCKEHALIFLALAGIYHLIFHKKLKFWPTAILLTITGFYLYSRLADYKLLAVVHPYRSDLATRLPGIFASLAQYGRLLVWPQGLHMEYGMTFFRWSDAVAITGFSLFLVLLTVLCVRWRQREISFPLLWFIVAWVPVSNLFTLNARMAEHWLYLPSVGFFMMVSLAVVRGLRSKYRPVVLTAAVAILIILGILTVRQNETWRDAVQFYERTIRFEPGAARMYNNLGTALQERGKMKEATEVMEKAAAMNPRASESHYNLGNLYALQGRYDDARICYRKAVAINPKYFLVHNNLGAIAEGLGQNQQALLFYKSAVNANPRYKKGWDNLKSLERKLAARSRPVNYV